MKLHDCDLCGSSDLAEIDVARRYTDGWPLHVCRVCGFVQVAKRRNALELQEEWAENVYRANDEQRLSDTTYTALMPAVQARQTFAAAYVDEALNLQGKSVCDIGAGEGPFLQKLRDEYGAEVFGIEPSIENCQLLNQTGISHFQGTAEEATAADLRNSFDVATVIWTLENSQSCRSLLHAAHDLVNQNGHIAVATGSRLLVPFKKPLQYYLGPNMDIHPFHFSANTLTALLNVSGFRVTSVNRFIDSDWLVMVALREDQPIDGWRGDDADAVIDFFQRWDADTQANYRNV